MARLRNYMRASPLVDISHDAPSSSQRQSHHDTESITRSRSRPSSRRRSTLTSEAASPTSSPRSYKILKGVARKGYYEDRHRVHGDYPSDEEREGGSVPCESESDGDGPILERSPTARKKVLPNPASPGTARSREKKSLALAMAFAKLKADYELKKSRGEATLEDDARFERAEIKERSRLDDLDKEKSTPRESPGKTVSTQGRHGMFGRIQPSPRKSSREKEILQENGPREVESSIRESSTLGAPETRPRVSFAQQMAELREVHKLPRLPSPYKLSRFWEGCDVDPSPEFMAEHWKYMEQLANEGKEDFQTRVRRSRHSTTSSPLSSPPATTPEDQSARQSPERQPRPSNVISLGTQTHVDFDAGETMISRDDLKQKFRGLAGELGITIDSNAGETTISRDVLKQKFRELAGELGITIDIAASTDGASSKTLVHSSTQTNVVQKRVNQGPPEGATETVTKKVRMDSGNSGGDSDDGNDSSDIDSSDDNEGYKTTRESRARESRESSSAWVRRSNRRFSNGTPLYRADRHPADEFLISSPKERAESVANSGDDESEDDEVVVHWPRKSSPQPRTPIKAPPAKSPTSSSTPKRRGRKPGTRVVNGKVVWPSGDGTPNGHKGLAETSSMNNTTTPTQTQPKFDFSPAKTKRTPILSDKARANAMNSKTASTSGTKKAPAQKTRSKTVDSPTAAKATAPRSEPKKSDQGSSKPKSSTPYTASKSTAAQSQSKKLATSSSDPRRSNTPNAAPNQMRIVNGFLRGGTENELESSSEVTMHNSDAKKKKFSFSVPNRSSTPEFPKGSRPVNLNRTLFRP
ncbi:hypothetical protein IWZ00DRAFT_488990 [Phyllosticta capitalensis]